MEIQPQAKLCYNSLELGVPNGGKALWCQSFWAHGKWRRRGKVTFTEHRKLLFCNSIVKAALPKGTEINAAFLQKCLGGVCLYGVPPPRAHLVLSTLRPPTHHQRRVRALKTTNHLPKEAPFSFPPDCSLKMGFKGRSACHWGKRQCWGSDTSPGTG